MAERQNDQVLLFRAANVRLGVFIAEVGRLVVESNIAAVPFAHPALAGLVEEADGQVVPVFDLRGLLPDQKPLAQVGGARVALFETDIGPVGLRLEVTEGGGLHYTFMEDSDRTEQQLAALPAEIRPAVTAVGEDEGGPFFFFSADAFLAALDLYAARRPEP